MLLLPVNFYRAQLIYKKKRYAEALILFTKSIKQNPSHGKSFFKAGMCQLHLKQIQAAHDLFEKALLLEPENSQWLKQLNQAKRKLGMMTKSSALENEERIRALLEECSDDWKLYDELAVSLGKQGKWWQKVDALKKAVALNPDSANLHSRLGMALQKMNRFQEAAKEYGEAISLKGNKAEAQLYYQQGYCFEKEGHDGDSNPIEAKKSYDQAILKDTKLNAKRYGIGVFHQAKGLWKEAQKAYLEQFKRVPWDEQLCYRLGMAYDRCYEWQKAEEHYFLALSLDIDHPNWHYRLGFVQERQNKFEQAAVAYQYAAKNCEKHTPYWFYRWGYVLEKAGQYEQACKAYLQTQLHYELDPIKVKPIGGDVVVLNDIDLNEADPEQQQYEKNLNQQSQVISVLENFIKEDTTSPEAWYKLGNAYERIQDWQEAKNAYKCSLDRQNKHIPKLFYRLGYVLTQTKSFAEACYVFRQLRVLQTPHGTSEKIFRDNENFRLLATYTEYYESLYLRKNSILFESFNGASLTCNPYAIFKYMLSLREFSDWKMIWVLNDLRRIPEGLKNNKNISFITKGSDAYLRAICQAEYLVNNSGFPPYFIRKAKQKYLATWHGTPLKTLGKEQKYKFFDHKRTQRNFLQASHIISPNPHTSKIQMDSYDIANIFTGKYAETGYPRIDLTVAASKKDKQLILDQLGLSEFKPVVLYAPTWRGTLQDVKFNIEKLETDLLSIQNTGCQVLFRGHSLLEGLLSELELDCTVVPESIDTNSLLSVVDILITDYSSIFFDFIPLNKPIIYYTYDLEEYKQDRGLYFEMSDMPGKVCNSIDLVIVELQSLLSAPEHLLLKGFNDAKEKYCMHDHGNASKRVVDFFIKDDSKFLIKNIPALRKNILIYPGGMEANGITTSFINLISNLDRNLVNPVIAFNPNPIENDEIKCEQFSALDYSLDFIPRYGNVNMTLEERYVRLRAEKLNYKDLSGEENIILKKMYLREFQRIFGNSRIDACVHFSGYDFFWSGILSSVDNAEKIIYLHNDLYSEYLHKFPYLNIVFNQYKYFDKLTSVSMLTSDLNKKNLSQRYALNDEKFQFCNNLHDPVKVSRLVNEPYSFSELFSGAAPVFVTMGRLSLEKDHEKLIFSFKLVLKQFKTAKLVILGDGPLMPHLKNIIEKNGLSRNIFLLGRLSNPFPLLNNADCFVLSSNHEGQPMVLFEAMILKKEIISTDIVGSRSALEGRSGHLVDNSIDGLAQGMIDFLENRLEFVEFDITDYQNEALNMFYKKVCGLDSIDS